AAKCSTCGTSGTECDLYVCLNCGTMLCQGDFSRGKMGEGHAAMHARAKHHPVHMSMATGDLFCYECKGVVDSEELKMCISEDMTPQLTELRSKAMGLLYGAGSTTAQAEEEREREDEESSEDWERERDRGKRGAIYGQSYNIGTTASVKMPSTNSGRARPSAKGEDSSLYPSIPRARAGSFSSPDAMGLPETSGIKATSSEKRRTRVSRPHTKNASPVTSTTTTTTTSRHTLSVVSPIDLEAELACASLDGGSTAVETVVVAPVSPQTVANGGVEEEREDEESSEDWERERDRGKRGPALYGQMYNIGSTVNAKVPSRETSVTGQTYRDIGLPETSAISAKPSEAERETDTRDMVPVLRASPASASVYTTPPGGDKLTLTPSPESPSATLHSEGKDSRFSLTHSPRVQEKKRRNSILDMFTGKSPSGPVLGTMSAQEPRPIPKESLYISHPVIPTRAEAAAGTAFCLPDKTGISIRDLRDSDSRKAKPKAKAGCAVIRPKPKATSEDFGLPETTGISVADLRDECDSPSSVRSRASSVSGTGCAVKKISKGQTAAAGASRAALPDGWGAPPLPKDSAPSSVPKLTIPKPGTASKGERERGRASGRRAGTMSGRPRALRKSARGETKPTPTKPSATMPEMCNTSVATDPVFVMSAAALLKERQGEKAKEAARERERVAERKREAERERERAAEAKRAAERERERERDRQREAEREEERQREKEKEREREAERKRERAAEKLRAAEREKERKKERERDRQRETEREKERRQEKTREQARIQERLREVEREAERQREREREAERERERREEREREATHVASLTAQIENLAASLSSLQREWGVHGRGVGAEGAQGDGQSTAPPNTSLSVPCEDHPSLPVSVERGEAGETLVMISSRAGHIPPDAEAEETPGKQGGLFSCGRRKRKDYRGKE
ncbi:hypothetical protein KIPB_004100, partial [Kipferlia bialata]